MLRKSVFGKKHNRLDLSKVLKSCKALFCEILADFSCVSKEDDSIRRFRYLLGLTDLFRHFIETNPNPRIKEIITAIDQQNEEEAQKSKKSHARSGGAAAERRRRTEQEEDAKLLKDEKRGGQAETIFRESPGFIKNGEMRDYQVASLN